MNIKRLSISTLGLASLAMLSGFLLVSSNTLADDTVEASYRRSYSMLNIW